MWFYFSKHWYLFIFSVFNIVFVSVQQKHLNKTTFDQQVVKTSTVSIYGLWDIEVTY